MLLFVPFRVIFVPRRLDENRRLKRRVGVGANVAASIDGQRKVIPKHTDGDIQTRTPVRHFSRVSDSARRRALVYRPKAPTRPFSTKTFDEPSSRCQVESVQLQVVDIVVYYGL